ncbi:abc transporter permease [Leptolyngbya sp. Heron Island J]|uniref:amino acid ABC transporter permease n=1 Tax=Leptolyngbya sp. Heron Island J TaxID=1385935 RepID=UPI0003B98E60|nr:amino acid ABC transporter permease [Leptolyngbya sp. Heron Island J]ESA32129.1 abc transporter permease [Leptolyngbya sp. Heron Island J]
MTYRFQFQVIWDNWDLLLEGVGLTLQLSALAIALGMLVGVVGALCRTSGNRYLGMLAATYVEAIRNTPFLVQLLFIFFGISSLGPRLGSGQAALFALTINFGAYATEIIRAGIQSIDQSQIEAGMSLGLTRQQIFRLVVLKPAIANIYPALTSQMVLLLLLSSVVSQISAKELTFMGNFLRSRTFRDFEVYFALAIIYVLLALSFKLLAQLCHRRLFTFTRYI